MIHDDCEAPRWYQVQFLSLSLSNFTLSFFIIITVGCKEESRSDLASHVWVLTSHARERHVLLKWAGKLSWLMGEAELAK